MIELAGRVLDALASSDVAAVRRLCAPEVVVFGTDPGERWTGVETLCAALDEMRELGLIAEWEWGPVLGSNWATGVARYRLAAGSTLEVRVTMVFEGGRLVHGHFSVEAPTPASA